MKEGVKVVRIGLKSWVMDDSQCAYQFALAGNKLVAKRHDRELLEVFSLNIEKGVLQETGFDTECKPIRLKDILDQESSEECTISSVSSTSEHCISKRVHGRPFEFYQSLL